MSYENISFMDVGLYTVRAIPVMVFSTLLNPFGVVPIVIRLLVALLVGASVALSFGSIHTPSITDIITEIVLGTFILLWVELIFLPPRVMAGLVSYQASLSSATLFNPQLISQEMTLERLLLSALIAGLIASGLSTVFLCAYIDSYHAFPAGNSLVASMDMSVFAQWFGEMFILGVVMSLPLVTAMLIVDVVSALMVRNMPQFNVYFTFIPLKLLMVFALVMTFGHVIVNGFEGAIIDSLLLLQR